jgi:hypothetical protein
VRDPLYRKLAAGERARVQRRVREAPAATYPTTGRSRGAASGDGVAAGG